MTWQAERIRRSGLAFFVDSRDTPDYNVSHVKDALSLPGHTTGQLEGYLMGVEASDLTAMTSWLPCCHVIS